MRTVVVVAFLALLVIVVARYSRRDPRPARAPRPGEDRKRQERLMAIPEDMVVLRTRVDATEAHVLYGLLVSAGIPATLASSRQAMVHQGPIRYFDLLVADDRAEEAAELLRQ